MKTILTASALIMASSGVSAENYGFPDDPNGVQQRDGVCTTEDNAKVGISGAGLDLMLTFSQDEGAEEMRVYRSVDDFAMVVVWSDGIWCMTGRYENAAMAE